jgi:tuberous sclerosis protein 2
MDRAPSTSKPSLSQQLLRSFRPRASTTAAPFTTSATASPISTPIDHAFSSELGGNGNINAFTSAAILDQNANLLEKSESFTLSDYQAYINELRQPFLATGEAVSEQEEKSVTDRLSRLHVLIYATNKRIDEEQSHDEDKITEKDLQQVLSTPASSGPPQAEVFKMCLHLLLQAREGLLPLSLRLGACELATASIKLSDIRAMKGTKAVRETRSGAPGSQSSKVIDADHPLANIDRAALYDLVCHLSDGYEADVLTKENWRQSQLPALPVQLKALEVLSLEGRDVVSFPGILDFLSKALEIVWKELQILRRLPGDNEEEALEEDSVRLAEQLSAREWSLMATLQLITSIIKCGFAMLDLDRVETVLTRIAGMFLGSSNTIAVTLSPRLRALVRGRSKSRERKPLTEGYDYYGLESITPMDQSRSASPTPKMANTPKLGAKIETSSIAPIALATLAPASSSGSSFPPNSSHLKPSDQQPILQTSDVRAVLLLIDTIIRFGSIPNGSVDSVTKILCCILGLP